jgi:hypothetical protein
MLLDERINKDFVRTLFGGNTATAPTLFRLFFAENAVVTVAVVSDVAVVVVAVVVTRIFKTADDEDILGSISSTFYWQLLRQ